MTKKELEEKRKYFKKSFKDANSVLKRGNIFMLAIGLLLGASFGAVVSSLAKDIIMVAITSLFDVQEVKQIKVGNILLGEFLAALIQFIIVSAFIFITLFVFYLIKNSIEYHKDKKLPIEEEKEEKVVLTTEELILEELKKINKELSKNNQEN